MNIPSIFSYMGLTQGVSTDTHSKHIVIGIVPMSIHHVISESMCHYLISFTKTYTSHYQYASRLNTQVNSTENLEHQLVVYLNIVTQYLNLERKQVIGHKRVRYTEFKRDRFNSELVGVEDSL